MKQAYNDGKEVLIRTIYSNFTFSYINNINNWIKNVKNNEFYDAYLLSLLKDSKFITYSYFTEIDLNSNNQLNTKLNLLKNFDQIKKQNDDFSINITICIEKQCFIFRSISYYSINKILSNLNADLLNVTTRLNDQTRNLASMQSIEEVKKFVQKMNLYLNLKEDNFINVTFFPILTYLIRRHFYPSYFFKDQTFFNYDSNSMKKSKIEDQLFNFFSENQSNFNYELFQNNSQLFKEKIQKQQESTSNQIIEFKSKDFVKLRQIHANLNSFFYLAIHIQNCHIFLLKKFIENPTDNEINFCNFLSKNPNNYFMKFYGFIKKRNSIKSIIYQYMSNDSLNSYFEFHKDQIDDIFMFTTACRILNGIIYLRKHYFVHRDLKPSNILIDHDGKTYISDFETIRLFDTKSGDSFNNDENFAKSDFSSNICSLIYSPPNLMKEGKYSLSTDVYSFGAIIYFLFEKKIPFSNICMYDTYEIKKMMSY